MEVSGKREKQRQSIKNEKTTEDIDDVKTDFGREKQHQSIKNEKTIEDIETVKLDSGFLSDASLSCGLIPKENIEHGHESHEDLKEKTNTVIDSGCITEELCHSSILDDNQKEDFFLPSEPDHRYYFQQNEDGET